ncbi:response regulator [Paenibacillus senegalensis]|uniref:response regulator n=1 Tax=Paenibacillus senegalensis TaxID=1465766 RepID=UPI00028969AB|nr:response regulator [Paenibacillus senegalensis]
MEKHTILIIDDTLTIIELFRSLIGEEYRILSATNGPEGIDIAIKTRPDLILLDVMMPVMDGFEVCKQLKENALTQSIPVIMITVLDHREEEKAGLDAGAIDYIAKPFHLENVRAKIKNHLQLQELLLKKQG